MTRRIVAALLAITALAPGRPAGAWGRETERDREASEGCVTSSRGGRIAPIGPSVIAGEIVVLRWEGLPAGVEELELLLSSDGGRTFPQRISPEMEGRERWYAWRVPPIATSAARLRVRARVDDREVDFPPGEPFQIVVARSPGVPVPLEPPRTGLLQSHAWWAGPSEPTGWLPASVFRGAGVTAFESATEIPAAPAPRQEPENLEIRQPGWVTRALSDTPAHPAPGSLESPPSFLALRE
jgi:hypothetical protein